MELNGSLDVQFCWVELPRRAVKLLSTEPNSGHGVKEVVPGRLARYRHDCWVEEKHPEDLEGPVIYFEDRLGIDFDILDFCFDSFRSWAWVRRALVLILGFASLLVSPELSNSRRPM